MKKILPLLLALLLLCSCSEARKNAPSESESPPSNSTEETAAADDLIPLGSYPIAYQKVYKKAIEKKGMRKKLVWGENGALNTTEEMPVIEYWITDENGNALIDQPFYEVNFSEKTYFGEAYTPEDYVECPLIRGCYEGNFYRYYFINGSFLLETYEESGDCSYKGPSANNTPFGYRYTRYYYDTIAPFYGLNDSEGNVLFEPVYTAISVPFEDRFLLGGGGFTPEEIVYTLVDIDGNELAQFKWFEYRLFEDGSYLGIAHSAGDKYEWQSKCYDENGNMREFGYWFVDKNGRIISPRFDELEGGYNITSPSDILSATDEDGNAVEIKVSDYLCKP